MQIYIHIYIFTYTYIFVSVSHMIKIFFLLDSLSNIWPNLFFQFYSFISPFIYYFILSSTECLSFFLNFYLQLLRDYIMCLKHDFELTSHSLATPSPTPKHTCQDYRSCTIHHTDLTNVWLGFFFMRVASVTIPTKPKPILLSASPS